MTAGWGCRGAVTAAAALLALLAPPAPVALGVPGPAVDPAFVPSDGQPGPETPMRQSNLCAQPTAAPQPDVSLAAPGFAMLNIAEAWQYSTGHGVPVAVIDTGVAPNPRLPVIPGGDYITGGNGLEDCDAHGTIVASVIAAAPQGIPMPRPMPPAPAYSSPAPGPTSPTPGPGVAAPSTVPDPIAVPDGVMGVAPHASVISIRQSSRAFEPVHHGHGDVAGRKKAGTITTLARAVVRAANLGAKVINISVAACLSPADPVDQREIGAAVWYAATQKDAVIVAAAGNEGEDGCAQNDDADRLRTVSSPSLFSDFVLSVGAVDPTGAPISRSLAGPWVGVAAPGVSITGLDPRNGRPVNAYPPTRPGDDPVPFWGTSFAAAYVSGIAALIRAKYPKLPAGGVIRRLQWTAHNPPGGVDNRIGHGIVDPVAALTFNVPAGDEPPPGSDVRAITVPAAPPAPDQRPRTAALAFAGFVVLAALSAGILARARRSR